MTAFLTLLVPISALVFLIGLVKPKWILFWMKEPDRLWASTLGLLLFMAAVTGYSELRLRQKVTATAEHRQGESADQRNQLQLNGR